VLLHLHACDPRDGPADEQAGNDCQNSGGEEFSIEVVFILGCVAVVIPDVRDRLSCSILNATKTSDEPVLWSIGLKSYNQSSSPLRGQDLTPMLKKNRAAGI